MKTPIQELIDEMTYMLTEGEQSIYALREQARKLLEKEKEAIKAAYNQGYRDGELEIGVSLRVGDISKYSDAEIYHNETFNTKEK